MYNDAYIVASGWGEQAQWFQNVMRDPSVTIQIGRRRLSAQAARLSVERAAVALADNARRHPATFRSLTRMMVGERLEPNAAGCARLAARIPLVALTYRSSPDAEQ